MHDLLETAISMHESGRLDSAAALYEQVLSADAENAAALHLLGVLKHQQGDHRRAIELISRAVAIAPGAPAFHANLAEAYRANRQFDRAVGCCRAALALDPHFSEAMNNLGLALFAQGQFDAAAEQYRAALTENPKSAPAHNNLGIALRSRGKLDDALAEFRAAAECDPNFAPAQTNLGQLLLDRNQPAEALPYCEKAVQLQPDGAEVHHNLGNALRDLARNIDARAAYLDALRLNPKLVEAHTQLGLMLQREGKFDDALHWLKQAAELAPDKPETWQHLAELHEAREDYSESAKAWQRVVDLSPDQPGPRVALGWSLQEEGRLDEAGRHYRAALQFNPDWAAAHMNLGGLAEELGDLQSAEHSFRAALKANPDFALPHARLATLLRGKLPRPDRDAIEQRLADKNLGDAPRSHLLFALAHVLDASGEYSAAAKAAREANALVAAQNIKDHRAYNPAEHEKFVDCLLAAFDPALFARVADAGSASRRPLFIFGLPRSGTTLIEQVLASHSAVFGAGELRLSRRDFEQIPQVLGKSALPIDCLPQLTLQAVETLADRHLESLASLDGGRSQRIVDKMPDNYLYVGLLAVLFPRATFIHCRRDLRDVAVSCWTTDFRAITWANDPDHLASRFAQYLRVMDHWRNVAPVTIHEIEYEQAVADFESVARRVIAACGLEWEAGCLEFHRTSRPIRTASVSQVRQPIYRRSVARWKNYEKELGDLFSRLPETPSAALQEADV